MIYSIILSVLIALVSLICSYECFNFHKSPSQRFNYDIGSKLIASKVSSNIFRIETQLFAAPPPRTPSGALGDVSRGPPKKKLKDDVIQVNGRVVESLPNAMFRVEIEPSKQVVLATISGKIRKNFVRIIVGDSVILELSAYDLTRGRITFRNK
mmetsp:Transcript_27678/g.39288  ORF Transcript_27678/g.39288 Transcript_27678/m.39288 type:complete len:154 (+) Transcript_27678:37-498(+)